MQFNHFYKLLENIIYSEIQDELDNILANKKVEKRPGIDVVKPTGKPVEKVQKQETPKSDELGLFIRKGDEYLFSVELGPNISKDYIVIEDQDSLINIRATFEQKTQTKYGSSKITKIIEHIVLKPSENLQYTAKFENGILTIKGTENG